MLHAGLGLSRNRLDVCLLSEHAELVEELAVPSVLDGVRAHGVWVGRKRVERLMRRAGISGLAPGSAAAPRSACPGVRIADNLVERRFRPARANVLWVADITYPREL